jgi:ribA/ribD-fused uncharacterized protein
MGGPAIINKKEYIQFDNFYIRHFEENGIIYASTEHYFQSKKNESKEYQKLIQNADSGMDAWFVGRQCEIRSDWEEIKIATMYQANLLKFNQHSYLKEMLIKTTCIIQYPGSDNYWGSPGFNILGSIIEAIRALFKNNTTRYSELMNLLNITHNIKIKGRFLTLEKEGLSVFGSSIPLHKKDIRDEDRFIGLFKIEYQNQEYFIPQGVHVGFNKIKVNLKDAYIFILNENGSLYLSEKQVNFLYDIKDEFDFDFD